MFIIEGLNITRHYLRNGKLNNLDLMWIHKAYTSPNKRRSRLFLLEGKVKKESGLSLVRRHVFRNILCKLNMNLIYHFEYHKYRLPRMAMFASKMHGVTYTVLWTWAWVWNHRWFIYRLFYSVQKNYHCYWFTRNRCLGNIFRYHPSESRLEILPWSLHSLYNPPRMLMIIHVKTAHRWSIE